MTAREPRSGPTPGAGAPGRARRWLVAAVCQVVVFLATATTAMLAIAVPQITSTIGLGEDGQQWMVAGYALAYALMLVPGGRLGDVWRRRVVFVSTLVLGGVAATSAALAQTPVWLVLSVLVLGGALGVASPQILGLFQQLFTKEERGRPYGLLGVAFAVALGSGPVLGGLLVDVNPENGWRLAFAASASIAFLAAALGLLLIPASTPPDRFWWRRTDPVGVVLFVVGMVLLWIPMVEGEVAWIPVLWVLAPVGVVVLAGFVLWEQRQAKRGSPLVDLSLLRVRSYGLGAIIAVLFGAYDALYYVFALYLQDGVGHSPLTTGLVMVPIAGGTAAGAVVGGRLAWRAGRRIVAVGLLTSLVGLAAVMVGDVLLPTFDSPHSAALPLLLAGLGAGFVLSGMGSGLTNIPNQAVTMSQVSNTRAGSAAGMLQTGHRLGISAGTVGVSTALFATLDRTGGNWLLAFRTTLLIISAFILVALLTALTDIFTRGRR
ncbi:MFS transporter [Salinispora cortesiana]|uniref:MFS transporter n=1 Tax=Salinispora cortesiana TaxID=1305843 RepID=UPI000534F5A5|nr:MFS transporter [Salinispora cortesiana]